MAEALAAVPDPRRPYGWRPAYPPIPLVALLQVTVAAMLCGSVGQTAIAQWVRERVADDPDLLTALGLPAGRVPCVATFHRVFKALDVAAFEEALGTWLQQTGVTPGEALAVDGKAVRGAVPLSRYGSRFFRIWEIATNSRWATAILACCLPRFADPWPVLPVRPDLPRRPPGRPTSRVRRRPG